MSGASGKITGNAAGDRIRQPLPIEQLLVWAYADQMVHEAQRTPIIVKSKGPLAAYSSLWSEGATPIDSSINLGFSASDDAWAIHEEVKKLDRVTVDCGQDLAATRYHCLGQYRGAEPPIGYAGAKDKTARGATTQRPWPTDGLLTMDVRMLVMIHASQASRPEAPTAPDFRFKPGPLVWHPKRRSHMYARGWFSHIEMDGVTPGEAREALEKYRAWWNALDRLRRQIQASGLTMFKVTDAMPPKAQAGA